MTARGSDLAKWGKDFRGHPLARAFYRRAMAHDDAKRLRYGMTYPDNFREEAGYPLKTDAELVLSMLAFLNSPYIPKEKLRPNRAARRQLGMSSAEAAPETTFVILRRPATPEHRTEHIPGAANRGQGARAMPARHGSYRRPQFRRGRL